ncbi:VRR-NUC domain protein [compost metagenome]
MVAAKLKAEGVRKGFLDLMLLTPRHGHAGLIIEMKRIKGSRIEPEQADWLDWLNSQGFMAVVCRGFDAARDTINSYLGESSCAK